MVWKSRPRVAALVPSPFARSSLQSYSTSLRRTARTKAALGLLMASMRSVWSQGRNGVEEPWTPTCG
jgi:hypothetical protein